MGVFWCSGVPHSADTAGTQPAVIYEDSMLARPAGQTEINRPTR